VNKLNKPIWVREYSEAGLPEDWADEFLQSHEDELISKLSNDLSPIKYANLNFNNIENQPLNDFPTPPNGYTFTEVVLLLFDVLYEFSKNLPKADKKIYSIYKNIEKKDYFDIYIDFPEFYEFCRQIQYNSIQSTKEYRKLEKTYNKYINDIPSPNTEWIVEFKESKCKVQVQDTTSKLTKYSTEITIYGQVINIIEDPDDNFNLGEFITLPVENFVEKVV
jgi:hypothetical protein